MENQINVGDQNTQQIGQNPVIQSTVLDKPKTNFTAMFLVGLACSMIFGVGGYFLGKQFSNPIQSEVQNNTPTTLPTPVVYQTDTPNGWKPYSISQLGLNFDLPPKAVALGAWSTEILPGDTGNNVCFHLSEKQSWLVKSVHAGGVGICSGNNFTINAVSKDFTAGRGGAYGDLSGYVVKNNELYVNKNNPATKSTPKELYEIKTNKNGVEYALLVGKNEQDGEWIGPVVGTPGDGYIGALINTNNVNYPGVTVVMKLESGFDKALLDSIMSTFKFTN